MSKRLIQDLHAAISRRDWTAVEQASNRLRDDIEQTIVILAGNGIGSLPNDYPLPKLATAALSAQVQDVADPVKAFARWLNNGPEIAKAAGNVIDVRVTTACGNKLRLTGGASPASKHGDAE